MPQSADPVLSLAVRIVVAYIEHNDTPGRALPDLIRDVYNALAHAAAGAASSPGLGLVRRATSGQTVFDDHLICMECGGHMKTLKRHLRIVHDSTPAQYRAKFSLPNDYPMVARGYAMLRSSLAKESGLGRRAMPRGR